LNKNICNFTNHYTKYEVKLLDHIFLNLPTLETERLFLRKLLYSDKKSIFEYAQNPEVAQHVIWVAHQTEFDSLDFLNTVYDAYNHNKAAPWGIQLKTANNVIGTAGFVNWDNEKKEAEIGYVLSSEHWNNGLATEAVNAIITFGFNKMNLQRINSRCKPENISSYKVLEKCGFNFDGIVKNQMMIKGELHDMRMYYLSSEKICE